MAFGGGFAALDKRYRMRLREKLTGAEASTKTG